MEVEVNQRGISLAIFVFKLLPHFSLCNSVLSPVELKGNPASLYMEFEGFSVSGIQTTIAQKMSQIFAVLLTPPSFPFSFPS